MAATGSSGAVFFFDGLDEVPPELRHEVSHCLRAWHERWPQAHVVVSCRVRSYQADAPWHLPFPDRTLEAFTLDEHVPRFANGWFAELKETGWVDKDAATLAEGLLRQLRSRPELRQLAPSPLLLTMMCLVHGRDLELPAGKALLYNRLVDLLLWEWESHREHEADQAAGIGLAELLQQTGGPNRPAATEADIKRALAELVYRQFQAWAAAGTTRPDVDELLLAETDLTDALMPLHPGCKEEQRKWAQAVVELIRQRSGLVMEVDDQHQFSFPHKTLAEFLCAFWLCEFQPEKENAFRHFSGSLKKWNDWREIGLLAAGYLARNAKGDQVLPWLRSLVSSRAHHKPVRDDQFIIAAEMLLEIGEPVATRVPSGQTLWQDTVKVLQYTVEKGWRAPPVRARAGDCLGWMGDPRKGVGLTANGLPDIAWMDIPAGKFIMGSTENKYDWVKETPQFRFGLITRPYRISRYPVTVDQFQAFVKAGGYGQRQWWREAIDDGAWKDGKVKSRNWNEKGEEEWRSAPGDSGERFRCGNHPVVDVNWFEATAFCHWLSQQLGADFTVKLPSEAEWERAARHTDGRTWPWGEEQQDIARRCNIGETGIGCTCAVGMFPDGRTVEGVMDMAGNAWEWCRTEWLEDYTDYDAKAHDHQAGGPACVVRGGSFNFLSVFARCAYRYGVVPDSRNVYFGFRVVAYPLGAG